MIEIFNIKRDGNYYVDIVQDEIDLKNKLYAVFYSIYKDDLIVDDILEKGIKDGNKIVYYTNGDEYYLVVDKRNMRKTPEPKYIRTNIEQIIRLED